MRECRALAISSVFCAIREPNRFTPEVRDEATIYLDLARACGAPLFGSSLAQRLLEWGTDRHSKKHRDRSRSVPQKFLMSTILRLTRNGSFDALEAEPHGRTRPEHPVGALREDGVATEDRKVALAPPRLIERQEQGATVTAYIIPIEQAMQLVVDEANAGGGR